MGGAHDKSSHLARGLQTIGDGFYDFLVDFIDCEVAFDQDYAGWFAEGDLAVFLPDADVEGVVLRFEAVFVRSGLRAGFGVGLGLYTLVAAAGADQRGFEARQKQEGEVRLEVAADESVKLEDRLRA